MFILGTIGGFFAQVGISLLMAFIIALVVFLVFMFTVGVFGDQGGCFTVIAFICCVIIPIIVFILVFFAGMTTDF